MVVEGEAEAVEEDLVVPAAAGDAQMEEEVDREDLVVAADAQMDQEEVDREDPLVVALVVLAVVAARKDPVVADLGVEGACGDSFS